MKAVFLPQFPDTCKKFLTGIVIGTQKFLWRLDVNVVNVEMIDELSLDKFAEWVRAYPDILS
jgi:hypothetical protein